MKVANAMPVAILLPQWAACLQSDAEQRQTIMRNRQRQNKQGKVRASVVEEAGGSKQAKGERNVGRIISV